MPWTASTRTKCRRWYARTSDIWSVQCGKQLALDQVRSSKGCVGLRHTESHRAYRGCKYLGFGFDIQGNGLLCLTFKASTWSCSFWLMELGNVETLPFISIRFVTRETGKINVECEFGVTRWWLIGIQLAVSWYGIKTVSQLLIWRNQFCSICYMCICMCLSCLH